MSNRPRCRLTPKDFGILETMLEHAVHGDEAFLRLLRQKLSTAIVMFREDIGPRVATTGSHVEYSIDGGPAERRLLVHASESDGPGMSLSISTPRGLAILGLMAGEAIVCEQPDGTTERIQLDMAVYRPETSDMEARVIESRDKPENRSKSSSVVVLATRTKPGPRIPECTRIPPEDDDPGPRAA